MNVKKEHVDYGVDTRKGYSSVFNGTVGQVLQNKKGREYYRRSPGVRGIIDTDKGLIISKEKRLYLDKEFDYRLPGGKVADTLSEYLIFLSKVAQDASSNDFLIRDALIKELKEEVGVSFARYGKGVSLFHISPSSSSVEHDLYYYLITEYEIGEAKPEEDEVIERLELSYKEVWDLLINKEFSEDRTRAVLYDFLLTQKKEFIF